MFCDWCDRAVRCSVIKKIFSCKRKLANAYFNVKDYLNDPSAFRITYIISKEYRQSLLFCSCNDEFVVLKNIQIILEKARRTVLVFLILSWVFVVLHFWSMRAVPAAAIFVRPKRRSKVNDDKQEHV